LERVWGSGGGEGKELSVFYKRTFPTKREAGLAVEEFSGRLKVLAVQEKLVEFSYALQTVRRRKGGRVQHLWGEGTGCVVLVEKKKKDVCSPWFRRRGKKVRAHSEKKKSQGKQRKGVED